MSSIRYWRTCLSSVPHVLLRSFELGRNGWYAYARAEGMMAFICNFTLDRTS